MHVLNNTLKSGKKFLLNTRLFIKIPKTDVSTPAVVRSVSFLQLRIDQWWTTEDWELANRMCLLENKEHRWCLLFEKSPFLNGVYSALFEVMCAGTLSWSFLTRWDTNSPWQTFFSTPGSPVHSFLFFCRQESVADGFAELPLSLLCTEHV